MNGRGFLGVIFGDDELEHISRRLVSFCLLVGAIVFAWLPHQHSYFWLWNAWISFTPDFLSGVLAVALITPLYARRLIPYPHHSLNGLVFLLVNVALTGTFIQIILGKSSLTGTFPGVAVIATAIALSWLGLRVVASIAWLVLLAISAVSTIYANYDWGFAGFGFVVCGFGGLVLQTDFHPGRLLPEVVGEYRREREPSDPQS